MRRVQAPTECDVILRDRDYVVSYLLSFAVSVLTLSTSCPRPNGEKENGCKLYLEGCYKASAAAEDQLG
jgi:hypothetical protein